MVAQNLPQAIHEISDDEIENIIRSIAIEARIGLHIFGGMKSIVISVKNLLSKSVEVDPDLRVIVAEVLSKINL